MKLQQIFKFYDFSSLFSPSLQWVSIIIGLCVYLLFISIFVDFIETRKKQVKVQKNYLVATASMVCYFLFIYLLIHFHIGRFSIRNDTANIFIISLGLLFIIFGTAVNIIGRINLGKNWSNQIKIYEDHKLITNGAYSLVRHPLYASLIWMFFGAGLVYQNYLALIFTVIIFIPAIYFRAKNEEILLLSEFTQYAEYKQRVGMFFPKIHKQPCSIEGKNAVSANSLIFCRSTTSLLLIVAVVFKIQWIIILVFCLMFFGAIFSIKYSPLLVLFDVCAPKSLKDKKEPVDIDAIRFAQGFGAFLLLLSMANLFYFHTKNAGWILAAIVGISTAFGASGHCVGAQIYYAIKRIYKHA